MTDVDALVAFIRVQLDEDERVARAADGPHWRPGDGNISEGGLYALDGDGSDEMAGWTIAWFELGETNPGRQLPAFSNWERHAHGNSVHAAIHDPARVLREVEAKRRILDEHAPEGGECRTCCGEARLDVLWDGEMETTEWHRSAVPSPCLTVRLLALPYASHPDYREEWAPPTE